MNEALYRLANELDLDAPANERLRLEFGYACALRVKHLLEDGSVVACLNGLGHFLEGTIGHDHADTSTVGPLRNGCREPGCRGG